MSVINQMLQSLDARGASAPASALPRAATAAPRRSNRRLMVIVLAGCAAVALTAFADWPSMMPGKARAVAAAPPKPIAVDGAAGPAAQPPQAVAAASAEAPIEAINRPAARRRPQTVALASPAPRALAAPTRNAAADAERAPLVLRGDGSLLPPAARVEKRVLAPSAEQRAQSIHRQATEAAQSGHRPTALQRAREAITLDPRHTGARHLAAVMEHELGATERAAQLLREGLSLNPAQPSLALLLARLLVNQGATDEALQTLARFGVTGGEADGLRAGVLTGKGDFKHAWAAYESALRQQPANPIWWLGLGVALESDGQGARARQAFARARALGLPREDLAAYVEQRLAALE